MLVAPKICQFPQNTQIILICFVIVLTVFQFSNICNVSYGAGDDPSDSKIGNFLTLYFLLVMEKQERGISLTGRIPYVTLQLTYPVWPRNGAFPQLPLWKQTFRNSKFEGRRYLLTILPEQKMKFFGFLSILGLNVKFSSVSAYLFKNFLCFAPFTCEINTLVPCSFFKLVLQNFEYRLVVNTPAVSPIQ
jgi:hypothetical protein